MVPIRPHAATRDISIEPRVLAVGMIILCAGIMVASHLSPDLTRNDFERFDDPRLLGLFFLLFVGLCALYVGIYRARPALEHRAVMRTSLVCIALMLLSFPVGSKDTFAYALLGRIWNFYGANPFIAAPGDFPNDPWLAYQSGQPFSVYGPLFIWQTWLVDVLGQQSIWIVVWLHKLIASVALILTVWLSASLLRDTVSPRLRSDDDSPWRLALIALNPLLLFECAGGGHNDVIMVVLLLGALQSQYRRHFALAATLLAVSFWYKWYSLVFVPSFLIATMRTTGMRQTVHQATVLLLSIVLVALIALAPLAGSMPAILGEWLHPQKMHGIYPNELSPPLSALFWMLRLSGAFASDNGAVLFDGARYLAFMLAAGLVFWRQWRAPASATALTESCCLVGLAAFSLLITQLWPWHLLTVIVLAMLCTREPFWLIGVLMTVIASLSYFLTFAFATLMLGAVVASLWLMRRIAPLHPTSHG